MPAILRWHGALFRMLRGHHHHDQAQRALSRDEARAMSGAEAIEVRS